MRLPVVEDHAKLAKTVATVLRREGMAVDVVGNADVDAGDAQGSGVLPCRLGPELAQAGEQVALDP